jgi:hypothetical protein
MNQNNEQNTEHVIGMHLLTEVSEANLEAAVHSSTKKDFDALLTRARGVVASEKVASWSLRQSATELGMDLRDLGHQLRLPQEVIQKLDMRLLHVASIPERLFDLLSDTLLVPVDYVRNYVALPPAIPVGIRFHAESGEPSVVLETFDDALLDEDDFSKEDLKFWLGDKC